MEKQPDNAAEGRSEPLASEIYGDLKRSDKFKERVIYIQLAINVGLALAILFLGLYHNWRWSQFDRVSVDSKSGPASYVQGENAGGVYFGASSSASPEGRTPEGDSSQEN